MKNKRMIFLVLIIIAVIVIICVVNSINKKGNNDNKTGEETQNSGSITSVQAPKKELPNETTDITLYVGENENYTQVPAKYNEGASKEEQVKRLIEKIGIAIGYKIEINNVDIEDNKFIVDFKTSSAPFDDSAYFGGEEDALFVEDYKVLVYRVFDSIKATLQNKYGEDIQVYYCVNGRGMTFTNIAPQLTIGSDIPYPTID